MLKEGELCIPFSTLFQNNNAEQGHLGGLGKAGTFFIFA